MFEKQRSIIAPPPGDHKGLYLSPRQDSRATAGDHKGPPIHIPAALAPTKADGIILRLMPIWADKSAPTACRQLFYTPGCDGRVFIVRYFLV